MLVPDVRRFLRFPCSQRPDGPACVTGTALAETSDDTSEASKEGVAHVMTRSMKGRNTPRVHGVDRDLNGEMNELCRDRTGHRGGSLF